MIVEITPKIQLKLDYYNYTLEAPTLTQGKSGDEELRRGKGTNQRFVRNGCDLMALARAKENSVFDTLPGEEKPDTDALAKLGQTLKQIQDYLCDVSPPEFDHRDWNLAWKYGFVTPTAHRSYKTELIKPNGSATKTWYPISYGRALWRLMQWDFVLGDETVSLRQAGRKAKKLEQEAKNIAEHPSILDPYFYVFDD